MEKNKELTPMMELIELIELQQKNYIQLAKNDKTKRKEVDAILTATTLVKMKAKSLLPKEKQVIEDAWENGYEHASGVNTDPDKYHGNQYYNTKYNNQIK